MILSVHQPQYLPWLGYFDKIAASDLFVFLDLPQYKKREFQNRNRVKGPQGEVWLTLPVLTKGRFDQPIREVELDPTQDWRRSHWASLELNYRKAPYWADYSGELRAFYERDWDRLCPLNMEMTLWMLAKLGISTPVKVESGIGTSTASTDRLIELCRKTGATEYLSGAGGRDYMDQARFEREGLGLRFQHYEHPVYRQQYPKTPFVPYLCALDLLFNEGPGSLGILRGKSGSAPLGGAGGAA